MQGVQSIEEVNPIIVANEEWPLPENLIKWVEEERMINGLIDVVKPLTPEESVGFAEVVAYLYPAMSKSSLPSGVNKIYLYCVTQVMKKHKIDVLKEIAVKELTEFETKALNELKKFIYKARGGKEKNPIINALKEVFMENKK